MNVYTTEHSYSHRTKPLYFVPHPVLSFEDSNTISTRVTEADITRALFSFQPLKAPGPDGLHPIFFQKFWDVVKPSVCNLIFDIFATAEIPSALNETFLALIPKTDSI